jgi:hypothetical protein
MNLMLRALLIGFADIMLFLSNIVFFPLSLICVFLTGASYWPSEYIRSWVDSVIGRAEKWNENGKP